MSKSYALKIMCMLFGIIFFGALIAAAFSQPVQQQTVEAVTASPRPTLNALKTKPPPNAKPQRTKSPENSKVADPKAQPPRPPSTKPAAKPTDKPTSKPTDKPTSKPTDKPTSKPADKPTSKPTGKPTEKPTEKPSATPDPRVQVITLVSDDTKGKGVQALIGNIDSLYGGLAYVGCTAADMVKKCALSSKAVVITGSLASKDAYTLVGSVPASNLNQTVNFKAGTDPGKIDQDTLISLLGGPPSLGQSGVVIDGVEKYPQYISLVPYASTPGDPDITSLLTFKLLQYGIVSLPSTISVGAIGSSTQLPSAIICPTGGERYLIYNATIVPEQRKMTLTTRVSVDVNGFFIDCVNQHTTTPIIGQSDENVLTFGRSVQPYSALLQSFITRWHWAQIGSTAGNVSGLIDSDPNSTLVRGHIAEQAVDKFTADFCGAIPTPLPSPSPSGLPYDVFRALQRGTATQRQLSQLAPSTIAEILQATPKPAEPSEPATPLPSALLSDVLNSISGSPVPLSSAQNRAISGAISSAPLPQNVQDGIVSRAATQDLPPEIQAAIAKRADAARKVNAPSAFGNGSEPYRLKCDPTMRFFATQQYEQLNVRAYNEAKNAFPNVDVPRPARVPTATSIPRTMPSPMPS